jgi:Septum formation
MTTTETKLWARALTVTTIAAAGLLLSGCSLLGQVQNVTGGGGGGDDTNSGTEDDVFSLVPGDCFNEETDAETVSTVDIVECSVPHSWEAFASIKMTEDSYPGDDATQSEADTACNEPFTTYVGVGYEESIYDYSFYYPTQDTWDDPVLQDREILCLGKADDDSLITGTIKGANK